MYVEYLVVEYFGFDMTFVTLVQSRLPMRSNNADSGENAFFHAIFCDSYFLVNRYTYVKNNDIFESNPIYRYIHG